MRKWILTAAATLCAASLNAQQSQAQQQQQQQPGAWMTVNFSYVSPANAAEYEKIATTDLAKVAQARIDNGDIVSWAFQKVILPAGADAGYTHVTVVTWKNRPVLDPGREAIAKTFAQAGVDRAAFLKKRDALGVKLIRTNIVRRIDATSGSVEPGDLVRVDPKLVSPSDTREYVELERNVYKANHEKRIQNGELKHWSLYSVVLPGGQDSPYNYATSEVFKDESQMFGPRPAAPGPAMRNTQLRMNTIAKQNARRVSRVLAVRKAPTT